MPKKIAIVDDEPHIRLLLEQTLEELEDEADVELLLAADGEEALALIKEHKPEVVFLDVMMPKMNGFEVCKIVKRDLDMKGVFVILLTAKGQEFDKQKGMESGANLYITKPFHPEEIIQRAADVLDIEI